MKPLRTLAVAGVVGAATLGGVLFTDLFGVPGNLASGQTLMARAPSLLGTPSGYASTPNYNAMPGYYATPAYNPASAYAPVPSYVPQPTPLPYGHPAYPASSHTAYPASGYGSTDAQVAPYQGPYQATTVQPSWRYVQSHDGQASVVLDRSESVGEPPLSSPHVQLPAPSHQPPHNHMPMQQTPNYAVPNHSMQMQPMQAYAMPGYPYGGAACDAWSGGCPAPIVQPVVRNWFGSAGAVLMTRDRSDHYTFSYGTGNEADQRTDTRNAGMGWETGFDVRVGRYFNCHRNAIEAVYWGLNPNSQSTQTVSADVLGNLNGILNWSDLDYGGNTADVYVNVAPGDDGIHRLTRDYSFQNIELNLWQFCGSCGAGKCGCSRLRHNWLVGARYFRFDENLLFASDADDLQITYANDEIFYNIDIENHLLGLQVGNEAQYCVNDKLTADFGIKLGLYSNQINHISEIGGALGVATINNGPFLGQDFYVASSKHDIAFLGEVNLGLRYCFNRNWAATVGYRALAITGVAMPADQIYSDLRGINDVANIDSNRGLILHGGYIGLEYNW